MCVFGDGCGVCVFGDGCGGCGSRGGQVGGKDCRRRLYLLRGLLLHLTQRSSTLTPTLGSR